MRLAQVRELLLQSLESELSGVLVYESAIQCAVNQTMAREWQRYLEETRSHVETLLTLCEKLNVDPDTDSAGRLAVRHIGNALVAAMRMARSQGDAATAQLVACECVMLVKTKDRTDWELIGELGRHGGSEIAEVLLEAWQKTGGREESHFRHGSGWCRELWIQSLGLPCALPPPEEADQVSPVAAQQPEPERGELETHRALHGT